MSDHREPAIPAGHRVWVLRYRGEVVDSHGAAVARTPNEGEDLGFATVLVTRWNDGTGQWEYELVTDAGWLAVAVPEAGDEIADLFQAVPDAVIALARVGAEYR